MSNKVVKIKKCNPLPKEKRLIKIRDDNKKVIFPDKTIAFLLEKIDELILRVRFLEEEIVRLKFPEL